MSKHNNVNITQPAIQSINNQSLQSIQQLNHQIVQPTHFQFIVQLLNKQAKQKSNQQFPIPKNAFYQALGMIANRQFINLRAIKDFLKTLNQQRGCQINLDTAMRSLGQIQFISCNPQANDKKLYTFQNQKKRGYVITGKAVSVYKRTKKNMNQSLQDRQARDQMTQQLQRAIFRLHCQQKLPMQKWQKTHGVTDFLMQFDLPNASIQPVYVANQVFSPFVAIQPSVVMLIPQKMNQKPDNIEFLKSSTLHSYIDQAQLLMRISSKILLRKGANIKGIIFIEEGEVQVTSGRIVARGWVTNGTCRNSSAVWKFKPMNFVKFIAKHQNVWKQYFNDIKINGEYPFDMNAILNINQQDQQNDYSLPSYKGYTKKLKLPKIASVSVNAKSFDYGKYVEIQKLRHYDDKIDDMFYYKKDVLRRKMKGIKHNQFQPLIQNEQMQVAKKARLKREMSKQRKYFAAPKRSFDGGGQNILIMSVLKRLQSLAGQQQDQNYQHPNGNFRYMKDDSKVQLNKKHSSFGSIHKITPLQMYQNRRQNAKSNHRYNKHW